jgi:hypothetical protein
MFNKKKIMTGEFCRDFWLLSSQLRALSGKLQQTIDKLRAKNPPILGHGRGVFGPGDLGICLTARENE